MIAVLPRGARRLQAAARGRCSSTRCRATRPARCSSASCAHADGGRRSAPGWSPIALVGRGTVRRGGASPGATAATAIADGAGLHLVAARRPRGAAEPDELERAALLRVARRRGGAGRQPGLDGQRQRARLRPPVARRLAVVGLDPARPFFVQVGHRSDRGRRCATPARWRASRGDRSASPPGPRRVPAPRRAVAGRGAAAGDLGATPRRRARRAAGGRPRRWPSAASIAVGRSRRSAASPSSAASAPSLVVDGFAPARPRARLGARRQRRCSPASTRRRTGAIAWPRATARRPHARPARTASCWTRPAGLFDAALPVACRAGAAATFGAWPRGTAAAPTARSSLRLGRAPARRRLWPRGSPGRRADRRRSPMVDDGLAGAPRRGGAIVGASLSCAGSRTRCATCRAPRSIAPAGCRSGAGRAACGPPARALELAPSPGRSCSPSGSTTWPRSLAEAALLVGPVRNIGFAARSVSRRGPARVGRGSPRVRSSTAARPPVEAILDALFGAQARRPPAAAATPPGARALLRPYASRRAALPHPVGVAHRRARPAGASAPLRHARSSRGAGKLGASGRRRPPSCASSPRAGRPACAAPGTRRRRSGRLRPTATADHGGRVGLRASFTLRLQLSTVQTYPIVLGTAGHIDHGKTALVRR